MKKTLIGLIAVSILAGTAAAPLRAQTSREVLDKLIAAQGGRAALEAIKDTTLSGTIEMTAYGMSGTVTMSAKEPDKMRVDIAIMGLVLTQAYDGTTAWMTDPQGGGAAQDMDATQSAEFRRQALGNDSLLHPEKYGITFTVKGREKIKETDYIVLEQTYADGEKIALYVDPTTYLVFKSRGKATDQTGAMVEAETFMSDYRAEGGLTVAHTMIVIQSGAEFMRMSFTKVTSNTGLEDAFFRKPK